jgi:hypothetical protein
MAKKRAGFLPCKRSLLAQATDIAPQLNVRFRARAPKLTEFEMPVRPQETGPAWKLMLASDDKQT